MGLLLAYYYWFIGIMRRRACAERRRVPTRTMIFYFVLTIIAIFILFTLHLPCFIARIFPDSFLLHARTRVSIELSAASIAIFVIIFIILIIYFIIGLILWAYFILLFRPRANFFHFFYSNKMPELLEPQYATSALPSANTWLLFNIHTQFTEQILS